MVWHDATQDEVFESIMRFYRGRLKLPTESVYPTIEPLSAPAIPPSGNFWISVALGDGQFPEEEQDDEQLREEIAFTVTGYSRIALDRATRETEFLFAKERGANYIKSRLLLIVGHQLTDPEGTGIAASRVWARTSHRATYDATQSIGWVGITFGVDFDWHIAGAEDLGDD